MLDFLYTAVGDKDADDVETDVGVLRMGGGKGLCSCLEVLLLGAGNGFFGVAKVVAGACLYLYKY